MFLSKRRAPILWSLKIFTIIIKYQLFTVQVSNNGACLSPHKSVKKHCSLDYAKEIWVTHCACTMYCKYEVQMTGNPLKAPTTLKNGKDFASMNSQNSTFDISQI